MAFFERSIRPYFDREFFEQVAEAIDSACVGAYTRSRRERRILPTQRRNAEGSDRYFSVQAAVMDVTVSTGGQEVCFRANGFPIPVGKHRRFYVTACVTDSLAKLKRSKARKLLATLNGVLEPYQYDFFHAEPPVSASPLFGLLVIARPKLNGLPAGIYFGVPPRSLQSWHFYAEIGDLIALYDPAESEAVRDVSDRVPKLRKFPRTRFNNNRRRA